MTPDGTETEVRLTSPADERTGLFVVLKDGAGGLVETSPRQRIEFGKNLCLL
jgi:hypothetical protein